MACLFTVVFFVMVFLTFLHPDSSKSFFFQSSINNSGKNDKVQCVPNHKREEDSKTLFTGGIFHLLLVRPIDPIKKILPKGTRFTYECCGEKSSSELIFRWGTYEQGLPSPSSLLSRVQVNVTGIICSVSWASNFKSSQYFERTYVEYNKSSHCVQWILTDIVRADENTYIATVRDDFTKGGKFRDCTPVQLQVSTASTTTTEPAPTASDPTEDATTSQRPTATGSEPSKDATTRKRKPPEPSPPTTHKHTIVIVEAVIPPVSVLIVIITTIILKCRQKRRETRKYKVKYEEDDGSDPKVNLLQP